MTAMRKTRNNTDDINKSPWRRAPNQRAIGSYSNFQDCRRGCAYEESWNWDVALFSATRTHATHWCIGNVWKLLEFVWKRYDLHWLSHGFRIETHLVAGSHQCENHETLEALIVARFSYWNRPCRGGPPMRKPWNSWRWWCLIQNLALCQTAWSF